MSLRTYLFGIFVATVLCWAAFVLTIYNTNPKDAGTMAVVSFFGSLFFALMGTFTLLGFYLRLWFYKNEIFYANIGVAFRQGIFLAIIVCGILGLQAIRLLTWWNMILFIIIVVMLEAYFLAKE